MAETCIVCLGDLRHVNSTHTAPSARLDDQQDGAEATASAPATSPSHSTTDDEELIAHLLPCGHNLHDSCLKPWVERANSCPICRAKFNCVELSAAIGGPSISSYAVQDKQQIADLDPALILDDESDPLDEHIAPCMVCETYGDEGQLLLCDGCNQSCHVFCAGLDSIPAGAWFCYDCQQDPQTISRANHTRTHSTRRAFTTRNTQREAQRGRRDPRAAWARLWQSVATRTDLDLDFPFHNQEAPAQRREAERREFQEWQRRFQVAARAAGPGAANRFRGIAPATAPIPAGQEKPEAESQEEIRAWNAFEKARIIDEDEKPRNCRKRKSRTTSPASASEPQPEPERKRKRPRAMRIQDAELTDSTAGESSRAPRGESVSAPRARRDRMDANGGPTFLQSLLDEVESHPTSTAAGKDSHQDCQLDAFPFGQDRYSSPDTSPAASSHGTPRSMTPPPYSPASPVPRPSSPTTLTSMISPVFPPAPDYSTGSPPVRDNDERARSRQRLPLPSQSPRQSPGSSPTRLPIVLKAPAAAAAPTASSSSTHTPNSSTANNSKPNPQQPTKTKLNFKTKSEIQAMVKSALKPHYQTKEINSEQYTDINRDVSRLLYEKVGTEGGLAEKDRWQKVAIEEVKRAVTALGSETRPGINVATVATS